MLQANQGEAQREAKAQKNERSCQLSYWLEHTPSQPTVETMMLDSHASEIDKLERPEVLSLLGNVQGSNVVELGAGIGRFTGDLCQLGARSVLAVDFMAASIAENQRINGPLYPSSQLGFLVEDATQMHLPAESCDVVFTNWLLMYLADEEVQSLAQRMLEWLTPGGTLFFRESCFKQSGDKPRKDNPTHYRDPEQYTRWFESVTCGPAAPSGTSSPTLPSDQEEDTDVSVTAMETGSGASGSPPSVAGRAVRYAFKLELNQPVSTYIRVKNNRNQLCWRWRKVAITDDSSDETEGGARPASPDTDSSSGRSAAEALE